MHLYLNPCGLWRSRSGAWEGKLHVLCFHTLCLHNTKNLHLQRVAPKHGSFEVEPQNMNHTPGNCILTTETDSNFTKTGVLVLFIGNLKERQKTKRRPTVVTKRSSAIGNTVKLISLLRCLHLDHLQELWLPPQMQRICSEALGFSGQEVYYRSWKFGEAAAKTEAAVNTEGEEGSQTETRHFN